MARRTYSLVDVAEKLGRARTTVNEWSKNYRAFLDHVGAGRTLRYTEQALEVFGLIAKMKDASEPHEYICDQLREVLHNVPVEVKTKDDGMPYLMQLSSEVDSLKRAVAMLADRIDAQGDSTRQEIASAAETLRGELGAVSDRIHGLQEGQQLILSRMDTLGKRRRWWLW